MNPGPDTTPTSTNCQRMMQWNANEISGKNHRTTDYWRNPQQNVNIAAIQEAKLINKTKPLRTPRWVTVRLDHHKNRDGGLLMLIKNTIPFVNNTAALPQSADPHLGQQGISITLPNRQQLHIRNLYIPPRSSCSAGHNASIAHLLSKN